MKAVLVLSAALAAVALFAAEDMTGVDGRKVYALPYERLRETLRKYGRLAE